MIVVLLLPVAFSCRGAGEGRGSQREVERPMAIVDGEEVPRDAYLRWLGDVRGRQARDEFVSMWLLEREARRLGVTVTNQEIDAARVALFDKWIRERLRGDAGALDAELERQGHDLESFSNWFQWQKRRELLSARVLQQNRTIDEPALRRRFEQRYGPGGVRTQVRVLVLTRARLAQELAREPEGRGLGAAELDRLLMQRAEALRDRALAGEKFEDLTRAQSNDLAVRKDGGVLADEQWRLRGAAFVRGAESAPLSVVQPPVANSSGVDLYEVLSRETTDFEAVRGVLAKEMAGEPPTLDELSALDERLRAAARIEYP